MLCSGFPKNGKWKKGVHPLNEGKDWGKVECKTDDECANERKEGGRCFRDCKDGYCDAIQVRCKRPGIWTVKGKIGEAVKVDESDNKDWAKVECKTLDDCKHVSEKGAKCYRRCDDGYCDANEVSCSGPMP